MKAMRPVRWWLDTVADTDTVIMDARFTGEDTAGFMAADTEAVSGVVFTVANPGNSGVGTPRYNAGEYIHLLQYTKRRP